MSAKHTPGPWICFYKDKHKYDEWQISLPMSGSRTWSLFHNGILSENPEADMRLIAAAPDMLAALRAVMDPETHWAEARRQVLEAIAKATGGNT